MGHGGREKKKVQRLSRGQSHDLLTHLEDVGLDPKMADELVQGPSHHLRAMIAAGAGVDWWSRRVCDWLRDVGLAIRDAQYAWWYRKQRDAIGTEGEQEFVPHATIRVPGYGSHGITTGAFVDRVRDGWGLFYMPPKAELPVEWFAEQVEGGLVGRQEFDHNRIQWELRERGYWFWLQIEYRIAPAGPNRSSPDHIRALVNDAERHPDATDAGMIVEVLGSIIGETCASIEEFLVASTCGRFAGWPLSLDDEKRVLRSTYASVPYTTRLLAMRIDDHRIGFGYWGDDQLADNHTAHGAGYAYRCAVERVVTPSKRAATVG